MKSILKPLSAFADFEPFEGGKDTANTKLNLLRALYRAFLRAKIVRGGSDGVFIGDRGIVFQLKRSADAGTEASTSKHPFKIYATGATRAVQIRSGVFCSTLVTTGTDGVEFPYSSDVGSMTPVVVPTATDKYWFWLDVSGTPEVFHSDDPASDGWDNFPDPDAEHIPIGWVRTIEDAAEVFRIRQLLAIDVVFPFETPP